MKFIDILVERMVNVVVVLHVREQSVGVKVRDGKRLLRTHQRNDNGSRELMAHGEEEPSTGANRIK